MKGVVLTALFARILIALSTRTFFQPDEYFQSLEVAHRLVFGYGHLTWEWVALRPIRSIFYPALNVPLYWWLKVLGLDDTRLLIWAPKVLHGALAAFTDISLLQLTRKTVGDVYAPTAFFLSLTSFFNGLSLSRSLSNSLETSLTTVALSSYPWDTNQAVKRADVRKMLVFAALACAVRATNAVLWPFMFGLLFFRLRNQPRLVASLLIDVTVTGVIAVSTLFLLDSAYYGRPTFTPLNFLKTNLSSVSLFYGSNAWHYYLTQAVPILCGTSLPFVLHGAWQLRHSSIPSSRALLGLLLWTIIIYSLTGHKEWRFIHPLLPLMHILASKSLVDSYSGDSITVQRNASRAGLPVQRRHLALILAMFPGFLYASLFHSRAQVAVLDYLRDLPAGQLHSVGFLMPCHSTPWQAYLHRPDLAERGQLWALGCEPPLHGEDVASYKDQTDIFYESPAAYIETYFPSEVDRAFPPSPTPCSDPGSSATGHWQHEWPEHLVMFGALLDDPRWSVRDRLEALGYCEVWSMRGWEGDSRRRGGVRVWRFCKQNGAAM